MTKSQLLHRPGPVRFHGPGAQEQASADLVCRVTRGREGHDLSLSATERSKGSDVVLRGPEQRLKERGGRVRPKGGMSDGGCAELSDGIASKDLARTTDRDQQRGSQGERCKAQDGLCPRALHGLTNFQPDSPAAGHVPCIDGFRHLAVSSSTASRAFGGPRAPHATREAHRRAAAPARRTSRGFHAWSASVAQASP